MNINTLLFLWMQIPKTLALALEKGTSLPSIDGVRVSDEGLVALSHPALLWAPIHLQWRFSISAATAILKGFMNLKSFIRDVPDFPKAGILFRDMSPLLQNPAAMDFVSMHLVKKVDLSKVDYFAGIESRGFILASHLAATHKKGFLPIRKAGKIPPPTKRISYALEYGSAEIELPLGQGRIMIIDDVLATGGTLQAAIDLSTQAGYDVESVAVLVNLTFLNKMKFNDEEVFSLVQY